MELIEQLRQKLKKEIYTQKFFLSDNEYFSVFAHEQGYRCDYLLSLKKELKSNGYSYNYDYDCYIKYNDSVKNNKNEIRIKRNEFLGKLIEWKVMGNKKFRKTKHNEQNEKIQ